MERYTFLRRNEIFGSNQMELFSYVWRKAIITDLSILLGGNYNNSLNNSNYKEGSWYTSTLSGTDKVEIINSNGRLDYVRCDEVGIGARPVVNLSSIKDRARTAELFSGVSKVEMGEFPQTAVDKDLSKILETSYLDCDKGMIPTGKCYSFNSDVFPSKFFSNSKVYEYEFGGNKYVRLEGIDSLATKQLSNGKDLSNNGICWVAVEPVVWLVDTKTKKCITEKIIFAGVPYNAAGTAKIIFQNNTVANYLNNEFKNSLVSGNGPAASKYVAKPLVKVEEKPIIIEKKKSSKHNLYNFKFNDMDEEELMKAAIESDIPVFLHGKSSEGKSARVKQIDKNCEILYLRNATPDSLNGKSVYNAQTGEMIDVPPTWYVNLKARCDAEPEKIHVLFFDEITNALPSIQGMAFNIVLDKEVNGRWKLPDNCRVVAAGNDLSDSIAANQLAEPLFNRFAHVYIETTIDKWLKWAAKEENNIHPAIYAYIACRASLKQNVLRSNYDGEKPNADPRKWEMASKVLWKVGNPNALKALIGEPLTIDFKTFCQNKVISIEDVLNGNYSEADLMMRLDERFATAIGLSKCKDEELKIVREFVGKLGAEVQATFDVLWAHDDEEKLEKIAELKTINRMQKNQI